MYFALFVSFSKDPLNIFVKFGAKALCSFATTCDDIIIIIIIDLATVHKHYCALRIP